MTIRTQYQLDQMAAAESRLISTGVLSPPPRTSLDDEWREAWMRACEQGGPVIWEPRSGPLFTRLRDLDQS